MTPRLQDGRKQHRSCANETRGKKYYQKKIPAFVQQIAREHVKQMGGGYPSDFQFKPNYHSRQSGLPAVARLMHDDYNIPMEFET